MTEDKTVSAISQEPKGRSLATVLGVLAVLIVGGLAFYLNLQKSTLAQDQQRLQGEITSLNQDIAALEGDRVEAAQQARQWLATLENEEIRWSSVLSQIQSLVPFDAATNRDKIQFLSYSGGSGGEITMNAQTRELRVEPFNDVAELIEVFNDSSFFVNARVPSITRGETNEGGKVASFVFTARYQDTGVSNIGSEPESEQATSEEPGVSRQ